MPQRTVGGKAGLTLVELLLALVIFGLLMTGLNAFIFSMGELWGRGARERLFHQHARAVTHFLDRTFREAGTRATVDSGRSGGAATATGDRGVSWYRPEEDSLKAHLLTVEVLEPPALLDFPAQRLPLIRLQLEIRPGEGLYALWNSELEKREEGKEPEPRETRLSPYLESFAFDYYNEDERRWVTEDTPRRGDDDTPVVPDRLRLRFKLEDSTLETLVMVPPAPENGAVVF
jgi:prepilin-type N-terminal cleavage/methylation domain-containing protein